MIHVWHKWGMWTIVTCSAMMTAKGSVEYQERRCYVCGKTQRDYVSPSKIARAPE